MSSVALQRDVAAFRERVASLLGREAVREPGGRHCVDGRAPSAVVAPRTAEDAARVLAEARAAGLAVVVTGSCTQLAMGNVPAAYDVALSTERLDAIVAHEPGDMTVTVLAGATLAGVQAQLGAHNQRLPLDPPLPDEATIGGVLATNACGPLRHACGTARDWVIGMQAALPNGSVVKSGGRVVKNVTGYDLHKLHIGALGTLGAITEVTFKTSPLPPARATVTAAFASPGDACRFVLAAWDAGLAIESAEVLSPAVSREVLGVDTWTALAGLAGVEAAVDRTMRDLRASAAELGGSLAEAEAAGGERWASAFAPGIDRAAAFRISVLPSEAAPALGALAERLPAAQLSATVAAGIIRVHAPAEAAEGAFEAARSVTRARGGSIVVDAAPAALKRRIDVFGDVRDDFAIMRRLKQQFDPDRVLAPGRFAGGL